MSATPLAITITPDLSVIKWFGRNDDPTVFTITNNDDRTIGTCKIYCVRGDFLPKGAGKMEKAFLKKSIGEDLISQGWLEARIVGDPTWIAMTDLVPLSIGILLPTESREFEIRLVVPDEITNEGKTNFALMVAASETMPDPEPAPTTGMVAWYDASTISAGYTPSIDVAYYHCAWTQGCTPTYGSTLLEYIGTGSVQLHSYGGASWDTFRYVIVNGTGLIRVRGFAGGVWYESEWGTDVTVELYRGTQVWLDYAVDAESGGYLSTWNDLSGNDYHAVATSTARPLLKKSILNGNPVVAFDGSNDFMAAPAGVVPVGSIPYTIYGVWLFSATDDALIGAGSASQARAIRIYRVSTSLAFTQYDSTGTRNAMIPAALAPVDTPSLTIVTHDGTIHGTIYHNGESDDSAWVDNKNTTSSSFILGRLDTANNYLRGYIAELLVYHTEHTPEEIAETEEYLMQKWGL